MTDDRTCYDDVVVSATLKVLVDRYPSSYWMQFGVDVLNRGQTSLVPLTTRAAAFTSIRQSVVVFDDPSTRHGIGGVAPPNWLAS